MQTAPRVSRLRLRPLGSALAQPGQLAGRPAAHYAQDLHAHALAQAQLLQILVAAQEQCVEADLCLARDHKADPLESSLVRKSFVVLAAFACFGSCSQSCPTVENAQPRAVWHAEHDFGAHELIIHSIKIICGIEMQGRVKIESVLLGQARGSWAGTTVRARGFRGQRTLCR